MEVKLRQVAKQYAPTLVTALGILTETKLSHSKKQRSPKLVTELGMVMEVALLQPRKLQACAWYGVCFVEAMPLALGLWAAWRRNKF